jgi:hypothetical protein
MPARSQLQRSDWTPEQAAQLYMELILVLLDGADDEDTVRPQMAVEALAQASGVMEYTLPELTAGEMRERTRRGLADLAAGERIP